MKNLTPQQLHDYKEKCCSLGYYVPIVDNQGYYFIVCPFKDENGYFRESERGRSIKEAMDGLGDDYGDRESSFIEKAIKYNYQLAGKPFIIEYKNYEIGDKVIYNDNEFEITSFNGNRYGINNGKRGLIVNKHETYPAPPETNVDMAKESAIISLTIRGKVPDGLKEDIENIIKKYQ